MAQSVNAETITNTGFNAKLSGVTLADLIQLKCLSAPSECFYITSGARSGVLHFSKGAIAHATTGDLVGDQAVLELLGWTYGTFEPASIPASNESSVRSAWQGLLLEAAKIQDERNRHVPLLSHCQTIGVASSQRPPIESSVKSNSRPWTAVASTSQVFCHEPGQRR
jgi:hypothetical protein